MKKHVLTEFILYRHRYALGYGLFAVALFSLLALAGTLVPGMLTPQEMASAVTSGELQFTNIGTVTDLPYHVLQKLSISIFGLTPLAIKLPSLIIAALTGLLLLLLLKRWFKQNVAVLASIIAVTTGQFLAIAQAGDATIMLLFWPAALLLFATYISDQPQNTLFWKICFCITAALSLYSPMSIYVLSAMFVAGMSHPHLRYMLFHMTRWKVVVATILGILMLLPLLWHIAHTPQQLLLLLGLPGGLADFQLVANLKELAKAFFGFTQPSINGIFLTPVYGFTTTLLMVFGLLKLAADHHSARTYTIGMWLFILGIVLIFQPVYVAITFIPLLLLLAIGIDTLFREWYGLFPKNPYARAAALLPLAILISGVVLTGVDRYINTYSHHPQLSRYFSSDLSLVRAELHKNSDVTLAVSQAERPFYQLIARDYSAVRISSVSDTDTQAGKQTIATEAAKERFKAKTAKKIVTNHFSEHNARFFIY